MTAQFKRLLMLNSYLGMVLDQHLPGMIMHIKQVATKVKAFYKAMVKPFMEHPFTV